MFAREYNREILAGLTNLLLHANNLRKNFNRELREIAIVVGLMTATFQVFTFFLPPSIILPIATAAGGVILVRKNMAKQKTLLFTVLIMAVLFFGISIIMTPPVSVGIVEETAPITEIDTYLKEKKFSGSALISRDGKILLSKGYGYANRNRMIPITTHTKFRIGSNTKQFTAMAILMLQERGRLNVQDKICRYIRDCPDAWKEITIHQLLTHTSGIPDYQSFFRWADPTQEEIIARLKNEPLDFKPGERYGKYSNTGYILLGEIIEQVSGKSYGEFLQDNIFVPLNMENSGYDMGGDIGTVGYLNDFLKTIPLLSPKSYAAGWVHSAAEDLYHWDQALNTGRLVSRDLLDEMFTAHASLPELGMYYGYGVGIGERKNHRVIRHGGQELGFVSLFERFPDEKITIILLSNDQNYDLDSIAGYIHRNLFGE